jgi:hypothetical protein
MTRRILAGPPTSRPDVQEPAVARVDRAAVA